MLRPRASFLFDLPDILQLLRHTIQHFSTQFDVRHLPAAVHHRDFHLVAVRQELARMPVLKSKS